MLSINPVKCVASMTGNGLSAKGIKYSVSNFKKWAVCLFSKSSASLKEGDDNIQSRMVKALNQRHGTVGNRKVSDETKFSEDELNFIHGTVGRRVSIPEYEKPINASSDMGGHFFIDLNRVSRTGLAQRS